MALSNPNRRLLVLGMAVLLSIPASVLLSLHARSTCHIKIHNRSGRTIDALRCTLSPLQGKATLTRIWKQIDTGATADLPHRMLDSTLTLRYEIDGQPFEYESDYIDLWTGETWGIVIGPDGHILQAGYEYDR